MKFPFFKKKRKEIPEKLFEAEVLRIADIVAPASIEVKQNYLKLGERLAKTFFIFSYPNQFTID